MRKRILGIFLSMLLALSCAVPALAALDYTLPEKLNKQLSIGSGLKGQFTLTAEGNDPLVLALTPFLDTEIQLRGLTSEGETHYYFYQDTGDEVQRGLTEFYLRDNMLYLRSDMLKDQVLYIPDMGTVLDLVTKSSGENPNFFSILWRIQNQGEEAIKAAWEPLVEGLTKKLELWIAPFADASVRENADGATVSEMNYTIPMAELKKEILVLLRDLRNDPAARAALEGVMTEEQRDIYLRDDLDYFYQDAMNALNDDFDVVISRTVSTLGEEISGSIELPLDESRFGGYSSLTIRTEGKVMTWTLKNENRVLSLVSENGFFDQTAKEQTWWYMTYPNTEMDSVSTERSAVRIHLTRGSEVSTDEDDRSHQEDRYVLTVEKDTSRLPEEEADQAYPDFTPVRGVLSLHYSSKYSQSSPTTLEITGELEMENMHIRLNGSVKSASPWIFSPFDISGAVNLIGMTPEAQNLLLAEWLACAGEQLIRLPEETAAPAETETEAPAAENGAAETEAAPAAENAEGGAGEEAPAADAEGKAE